VAKRESVRKQFDLFEAHWSKGSQMTVFVIAQLKFTDRQAYDRYQNAFPAVFAKFKGRVLAADESPEVLEGSWDRDKLVLLSFPDRESCRAWARSDAYRWISVDRRAGADSVVVLVKELGGV
jgi:uncharacterized protein (DUF1330 family)